MAKSSKFERMKFIKMKASEKQDIKSQMLRDYLDPDEGQKYKNIDEKQIEIERNVVHLPMSLECKIAACRRDISKCANFEELKR